MPRTTGTRPRRKPVSLTGGPDRGGAARFGTTVESIRRDLVENLICNQARFPEVATRNDWYHALALTVRDRLQMRWIQSARTYFENGSRTVVYLSAEYLPGPQLGNNLACLGIEEQARTALAELGIPLDDLLEHEEEPGLGNGGLGRLAACFMDSLATLQVPAIGYGIRYEFGIFDQALRDGWQVEMTDRWLRYGNPWEIAHPEIKYTVPLGGRIEASTAPDGRYRVAWIPDRVVVGTPYDTAVLGHGVENANMLRLWRAEAHESFDFQAFNTGDYWRAVGEKVVSENITKVLYPNDEPAVGKRLRLEQQFFFVCCSLQDMIRIYLQREKDLTGLCRKYAVQLNDTHPALAVAELMRLLVDVHGLDWEPAWQTVSRTFSYTNHTLLPEALETWPLPLFAAVLPRHLEIIYEINRRFLDRVRTESPGDDERVSRLSLIGEQGEKRIRMANLACVGSHTINGVARLHSELLRQTVLADFAALRPDAFCNVTNGVAPRRFLALANPGLARLLTEAAGPGWETDLDRLRDLERLSSDPAFREDWRLVQRSCKRRLADHLFRATGERIDPETLFDVHVKRIHEYKRQHLNLLHVITLFNRLRQGRPTGPPRTVLFAGKAAPGYRMAKLIIKLINSVAATINRDPEARERLRVVFMPDFNVKNAQRIYPAADLSEQISLAGTEASGTGNMKFALNGALSIGTLDGANIEILEAVGPDGFFTFGLDAAEVRERKAAGHRPWELYEADAELRGAIDAIADGTFSDGDRERFKPLIEELLGRDEYLLLADYRSYLAAHERASALFADADRWTGLSIATTARMGYFSSDRAIREYCERIWKVGPEPVSLPE